MRAYLLVHYAMDLQTIYNLNCDLRAALRNTDCGVSAPAFKSKGIFSRTKIYCLIKHPLPEDRTMGSSEVRLYRWIRRHPDFLIVFSRLDLLTSEERVDLDALEQTLSKV